MAKYSSHGAHLQVEIASVFTTVAQLENFTFPNGEVLFFDADSLDAGISVPDGALVGQSTPGECPFSGFYDPANAVHLLLAKQVQLGGTIMNWKIVCPDTGSTAITFSGSIKNFVPKVTVKDGFKFDGAIKLSACAAYPTS